jgi:hypothetical protein
MSKRKSQRQKAPTIWPYTPEPSPRLKPLVVEEISEDITMEEPTRPRPISMVRKEGLLSPNRPTLEDVLNNTAPQPYTLAAYTAFLSQQHCLETLEFVTEARRYSTKYDEALAAVENDETKLTTESDEGFELMNMWTRLLDVYVKPGAPREINLPAEERDDLVEYPYEPQPAPPAALDPSVKRMYDLMSDSIFIPFCNSLKVPSHAQTYSAISELRRTEFDPSRMTFDDRSGMSRAANPPKRRESPPAPATFSPSRSPPSQHRAVHSSSLSSALSRTSAGNRLSTHVSHSSAASESALTDGSDPDESAVMTPPTTPPTSELGGNAAYGTQRQHHQAPTTQPQLKPHRSESGAWKKTMKFFGGGGSGSNYGKKDRS